MRRKKILGSFFSSTERDDVELLKEINKRSKLEQQKLATEKLISSQSKEVSETYNNEDNVQPDISLETEQ